MSEIIFDNEVREIGEINWENPFADYVVASWLPNNTTGNDVKNLVDNTNNTYPDTLIWNTDGSVSRTNTTGTNSVSVSTIDNINNKEVIILCELAREGSTDNREFILAELYGGSTDFLSFRNGTYSSGTVYTKGVLNNSTTNPSYQGGSTKSRTVYMVHYKVSEGAWDIYADGLIVASATGRVTNPFGSDVTINLGVGSEKDKLYSNTVMVKNGVFTGGEIESLASNPYQLFKTDEDVQDEYGLKFLNSGLVLTGLPNNNTTYKITLAGDMPTSPVPNAVLFDNRYGGTDQSSTIGWSGNSTPLPTANIRIADIKLNGVASDTTGILTALKGDVIEFTSTGSTWGEVVFGMHNTGSYPLDGLFIASIQVTDSTSTFLWAFNETTLPTNFIDHYNGALATPVNMTDANMQRIVPVEVFTDNDYPLAIDFANARQFSSGLQVYQFSGIQEFTTDFDVRTGFDDGAIVEGVGSKFTGNFNDLTVARIQADVAYTGHLFDERTNNIEYKNLIIDATVNDNVPFSNNSVTKRLTDVGIHANGVDSYSPFYSNNSLTNPTINRCVLWNESDRALYRFGEITANECIFVGASTNFGNVRLRNATALGNFTNCLSYSTTGDDEYELINGAAINGSNNLTTDVTAATLGIGTQDVNLATYFTDAPNGDFTINETGQTALSGQGWNGSDIVGWAYSTMVPPPVGGENFTATIATSYDLFSSLVTAQSTLFDLYSGHTMTLTTSFDQYSSETSAQGTLYDLFVSSTKAQSTSFDLYEGKIFGQNTSFDLYSASVVSQATSFDLYSAITKVMVVDYALGTAVPSLTVTLSTSYDLYRAITKTQATSFDLYLAKLDSISTAYDLYGSHSLNQLASYDMYSSTTKAQGASFDLYNDGTSTQATNYDLYRSQQGVMGVEFDLYSSTTAEISTLFDLFSSKQVELATSFDLYNDVTGLQITEYDVYSSLEFKQTTYFDLGATELRIVAKRKIIVQNEMKAFTTQNKRVTINVT